MTTLGSRRPLAQAASASLASTAAVLRSSTLSLVLSEAASSARKAYANRRGCDRHHASTPSTGCIGSRRCIVGGACALPEVRRASPRVILAPRLGPPSVCWFCLDSFVSRCPCWQVMNEGGHPAKVSACTGQARSPEDVRPRRPHTAGGTCLLSPSRSNQRIRARHLVSKAGVP